MISRVVLFLALFYATYSFAAFEETFQELNANTPGCAIGIVSGDKLIYENYMGQANLKYQVPIDSRTVFNVGSISKHLTAAVIFQLEQEGKLSRDDQLSKYYSDGPKWFGTITLEHLLTHRSGLPDYRNDEAFSIKLIAELNRSSDVFMQLVTGIPLSSERIFSVVMEGVESLSAPEFVPGSQYNYSNTGYLILADVLGKVSQIPFQELIQNTIFKPLGMKSTAAAGTSLTEIPWSATGYIDDLNTKKGFRSLSDNIVTFGDGGVLTTVSDFSRWLIQLMQANDDGSAWQGFLLNPEVDAEALADDGWYANGLSITKYSGLIYSHDGRSMDNVNSYFWFSPSHKIGYLQFCNRSFEKHPSKYDVFKFVTGSGFGSEKK